MSLPTIIQLKVLKMYHFMIFRIFYRWVLYLTYTIILIYPLNLSKVVFNNLHIFYLFLPRIQNMATIYKVITIYVTEFYYYFIKRDQGHSH